MKKLVAYLLIACICFFSSACGDKTHQGEINNQVSSVSTGGTEYNSNTPDDPGSDPVDDIKPLEASDFSVSDAKNSINLDSPYKDFKIDLQEEELDNNYVGETYSGDFVYKTYIHSYADFDIYVSNTNYNIKNRNFDEYYITQIVLKNSNFKTYRGITVGSRAEDVIRTYGQGDISTEDGKTVLIYKLNDMEMSFTVDENQRVQDVVLRIITEDMQ
mgnify:CR=1 FL=1